MHDKRKLKSFKPVPGFENYMINKKGKIYSINRKGLPELKAHEDRYGYLKVILSKNGDPYYFTVHRLVALTFIGKSKRQVNHLDHNRKNNNLKNLEYCTSKQNIRHGIKSGNIKLDGHLNPNSKTSKEEIFCTGILLKNGLKIGVISEILCLPVFRIKYIKRKKLWENYAIS